MAKIDPLQYKGHTYMLVADLPCSNLLTAGKRKELEGYPANLVFEYIRFVNEGSPRVFLLENVKGLLLIQKGHIFEILLQLFKIDERCKVYYKLLNNTHY